MTPSANELVDLREIDLFMITFFYVLALLY